MYFLGLEVVLASGTPTTQEQLLTFHPSRVREGGSILEMTPVSPNFEMKNMLCLNENKGLCLCSLTKEEEEEERGVSVKHLQHFLAETETRAPAGPHERNPAAGGALTNHSPQGSEETK